MDDELNRKTIAIDYVEDAMYAVIEIEDPTSFGTSFGTADTVKILERGACPVVLLRNWMNHKYPLLLDFIGGEENLRTTRLQIVPSELVHLLVEMSHKEEMTRAKNIIRSVCAKARLSEKKDPKASTPINFGKARKKTQKPEQEA